MARESNMIKKGDIPITILKENLECFAYCSECTTTKGSQDCKEIMESDGFTQATDFDGCGFEK